MEKGIAEINVSDSDELRLKKINENFKNIVTGKTPVGAVSTSGGMYSSLAGTIGTSLGGSPRFANQLSTYMIDAQYITAQRIHVDELLSDYAQVNFANIGSAAINELFANKIAVENIDASAIAIHKALDAVRINASAIDANSITADKIRILNPDTATYQNLGEFVAGSVGLWKLLNQSMFNTDAEFEAYLERVVGIPDTDPRYAEEVQQVIKRFDNGIDGGSIIVGTIDATRISVDDLFALRAKIGGLTINDPENGGEGGLSFQDPGGAMLKLTNTGYFKAGSGDTYIEVDPNGPSVNIQATTLRTKEDIVIQNTWKWDMTAQGALNLVYIGA